MSERPPPTGRIRPLSRVDQAIFAIGDLTVNTALSAMSLVYTSYFLTQVAGLRPALAGLVPLIGRVFDAIIDPFVGRISDRTRLASGRRRPYFLLGAIPFGLSFAAMWLQPTFLGPLDGQAGRFVYYSLAYCSLALWMAVLSIPYMALIGEMALDYDGRTSINSFRSVGSLLGVFVAIAIRPIAEQFGGGATGFAISGAIVGAALVPPWLAVHRVSFERPGLCAEVDDLPIRESMRAVLRNEPFRHLLLIFLPGRIAMDLISALLILYATFWIGRSSDFEPMMGGFLLTVVCVLPVWLYFARGRDKHHLLQVGTVIWILGSLLFVEADASWTTATVVLVGCISAIGFASVDLMPWAMLGEVVDHDEEQTGQRRDGLYNGFFVFFRKLAGAIGVFLVMSILDVLGFRKGAEQTEVVRQAIRWMTFIAPSFFLLIAFWAAIGYPLTRARHAEIHRRLDARRGDGSQAAAAETPPRT